jgi:hypothetical protein
LNVDECRFVRFDLGARRAPACRTTACRAPARRAGPDRYLMASTRSPSCATAFSMSGAINA